MRRTAGTKELPPVRNTRSTSRWSMDAFASASSSASSIASSSGAIHDSNSARVTATSISKPAARNVKRVAASLESASFASDTAL